MFSKLVFLVLAAGATAAALLVLRQQRIETSHEMSRLHNQIMRHERVLWHLRGEIATACGPEAVRLRLTDLDAQWAPIQSAFRTAESEIRNPQSSILDPHSSILDPHSSILDPAPPPPGLALNDPHTP
ncbi:MAG: hypothetical protein GY715_10400 [Planctomycetes bacterium]|nr:hypothetical protein [Planctomycetota bacterium]